MQGLGRLVVVVIAALVGGAAPMEDSWEAVHAAVHGFARGNSDLSEDPEQRQRHRRAVADVVFELTSSREERAALLAAAHAESLLALRIAQDRCKPGECDNGRARGVWQVHRLLCPLAFDAEPGEARLRVEGECALRYLRHVAPRCGGLRAAVAGFTGICSPGDRLLRERAYDVAVDVLTRGGWPQVLVPSEWIPASSVGRTTIRAAWTMSKGMDLGSTFSIDGYGVLVDWHWHDPSGDTRPKGWHRGLTFFQL